jgi:CheY-like chemotaxis protein
MPHEFHILLVEDSPADVLIIDRALTQAGMGHRLSVIADGRLALDYLHALKDPITPHEREPDLIVLDLNLPGIDGHQVLSDIKADPFLRTIPLVVLTTSGRDEDVLAAYGAGANSFIQKPSEYSHYIELADAMRRYWIETATRPPRNRRREA